MDRASALHRIGGFDTVVLATGHMTDLADRSTPRFPESAVPGVEAAIEQTLAEWGVGESALLICGGARGADLIAARVARRRGATVWLLLADEPDQYEIGSVAGAASSWIDEFRGLVHHVPSWVLADRPAAGSDEVYAATNAWMLSIAQVQAGDRPVHVLAVWDGRPAGGPGGAADVVERARGSGALITTIDPITARAAGVDDEPPGTSSAAPTTVRASQREDTGR